MSRGCSICSLPQAAAIDAALAAGRSQRAVAHEFGVPRSTLGRHVGHADPVTVPVGDVEPGDQLAAAVGLLASARTERQRLSGLEAVRRAIRLELKDFSRNRSNMRAPTDEQRAELAENVRMAWATFESVKDRHDLADRALSGIRSAVDALRSAQAAGGPDTIKVTIVGPDGKPCAVLDADRAAWERDIPAEYRGPGFGVSKQMHFNRPAETTITDTATGEVLWSSPKLAPPPTERRIDVDPAVIAHDPEPNGHHA